MQRVRALTPVMARGGGHSFQVEAGETWAVYSEEERQSLLAHGLAEAAPESKPSDHDSYESRQARRRNEREQEAEAIRARMAHPAAHRRPASDAA